MKSKEAEAASELDETVKKPFQILMSFNSRTGK